jgi:hypothetical protein
MGLFAFCSATAINSLDGWFIQIFRRFEAYAADDFPRALKETMRIRQPGALLS